MAVKAVVTKTIYKSIDISSTRLYYKLVNAGSSAPSKPANNTTHDQMLAAGWSTAEPTFDVSKDLYATMQSLYSDNSTTYSDVTKYSSYEAAKLAYNTANTAGTNATNALNKVNNLQVGGRNLILKTNQGSTNWIYAKANGTSTTETDGIGVHFNVTTASTSWQMITYKFDNSQVLLLEPYTEYVLSFDYKTNMGTSNFNASATVQQGNATNQLAGGGTTTIINDGEWHRAVFILTSNGLTNNKSSQFVYLGGFNKLGDLYCKNIKFEKGNKPTDWSPAPEDIDFKINGKIESYYQSSDPSSSWSTSVEKETHIGDIWYNTTNQKTFVYYKNNTNPVTYEWKWQNVPTELIDSVNGKATIYSGVIPSNYSTGDYWLIPLNCYSNTQTLQSQSGQYSVGSKIKLGRYTLTVNSVGANNAIATYSIDVPLTSNYDIDEIVTDGMITVKINSVANFDLPTDCYGGSMCVATSNGTTYNKKHWLKRNDYIPKDKADTYATQEDVDENFKDINGKIEEDKANINKDIQDINKDLKQKIDDNYDDLNDQISDNYDDLDNRTDGLETWKTNFTTQYGKDTNTFKADLKKLEDRLVATIQATSGGNNLLRNSVGFRQKQYWTEPSSGIIEQQYSTLADKDITVQFKYRKSDTSTANIVLGYYNQSNQFVPVYSILSTSAQVNEWTEVTYAYKSSRDNPVIRFNSTFEGIQDNEAQTYSVCGSKLKFTNNLYITDLIIAYGVGKGWSPYKDELYGKTYNLDAYGLDIRDSLSDKQVHLDADGLDFANSENVITGTFSPVETKTQAIYISNSINIGNLHIVNIDNNNILEY